MKALAKTNPKGKHLAAYGINALAVAGLAAAGSYALTRNRQKTIASAVFGAVIGLAIVGYTKR